MTFYMRLSLPIYILRTDRIPTCRLKKKTMTINYSYFISYTVFFFFSSNFYFAPFMFSNLFSKKAQKANTTPLPFARYLIHALHTRFSAWMYYDHYHLSLSRRRTLLSFSLSRTSTPKPIVHVISLLPYSLRT